MKRFWDTVIEPILEATRPRNILEIGSDKGPNTRNLLQFCERNDATLHVIDPAPKYEVSELEERYGERFVFHRGLSLNVLPTIGDLDLVLVDGDHNWYTVLNELQQMERRSAELSHPFPLVLLHDVGWPYGRRDLYYAPETIPEEHRKPHEKKGIRPGEAELLESGGMNRHLHKASHEGGPHNGVLTAVEDFQRESSLNLDLVLIPGFHGLAILVPPHLKENEELAKILKTWDLPPVVTRHIHQIEKYWLEAEVRRQELQARMKSLRQRREEEVEDLRAKRKEMAEVRRQLVEVRRRLTEMERKASNAENPDSALDVLDGISDLAGELQLVISRISSGR